MYAVLLFQIMTYKKSKEYACRPTPETQLEPMEGKPIKNPAEPIKEISIMGKPI